jgi:sugar phosphate isomerase/epimerase
MPSRRQFLQTATSLSAAALSLPLASQAKRKSSFKLGLQLYTIRDAMEKDLVGTFKKISGYGYREVETYGFNYGKNKYYWGRDPKEAKQLLTDANLTTPSGHYDLDKFFGKHQADELKRYVDQCIEGATILKQSYIVWPWLAPEYRELDEFKRLASTLNTIGEQIKSAGLQLAYHNHDFEFTDHQGSIGYDILLSETDTDLVKMEMDLYWVSFASRLKPGEWFKKQPHRFVILHIKDMDKQNRELHTTVGDGVIDFNQILKNHKISGVKHLFVEQGNNYIPDSMSCVERSARFVSEHLLNNL